MDNGNVVFVSKALSHFGIPIGDRKSTDYEPFFSSLAEDVVLEYADASRKVIQGKSAVVDWIKLLFSELRTADETASDYVCLERPLEFIGKGDRIVALGLQGLRDKAANELKETKEIAIVVDVSEGQVKRMLRFNP